MGWVTCVLRCVLSHEKSQERPPEAVGSGLLGPCASPVRVAVGELVSQWGYPSQEGCLAGLGGPSLAVLLLSLWGAWSLDACPFHGDRASVLWALCLVGL